MLEAARRRAAQRPESVDNLEYTYSVVSKEVTRVAETFRVCDRVDSPRIPFEILRSLSYAASTFAGANVETVVHLSNAYNYEISSMTHWFSEYRWLKWWRAAAPEGDASADILLMVFPSYEVGTTLLHAAAAHELGHVIAQRRSQDVSNAVSEIVADVLLEFKDERREFVEVEGVPRNFEDAASDRAWRYLLRSERIVSTDWVRETFADLVAARLVGPAYLAVMDRISVGHSGDPFHPPIAVRRRLISTYLRRFLRHVSADPAWRDVKRGDAPSVPRDIVTRIGTRICERSLDRLAALVNELDTPLADRKALAASVRAIGERLDNLAPPSLDLVVDTTETAATAFWLLIYATARYRVSVKRFREFSANHGWSDTPDVSENALNSMLLNGLQNLDVKLLWHRAEREAEHATK
jgi:hypothetical protein